MCVATRCRTAASVLKRCPSLPPCSIDSSDDRAAVHASSSSQLTVPFPPRLPAVAVPWAARAAAGPPTAGGRRSFGSAGATHAPGKRSLRLKGSTPPWRGQARRRAHRLRRRRRRAASHPTWHPARAVGAAECRVSPPPRVEAPEHREEKDASAHSRIPSLLAMAPEAKAKAMGRGKARARARTPPPPAAVLGAALPRESVAARLDRARGRRPVLPEPWEEVIAPAVPSGPRLEAAVSHATPRRSECRRHGRRPRPLHRPDAAPRRPQGSGASRPYARAGERSRGRRRRCPRDELGPRRPPVPRHLPRPSFAGDARPGASRVCSSPKHRTLDSRGRHKGRPRRRLLQFDSDVFGAASSTPKSEPDAVDGASRGHGLARGVRAGRGAATQGPSGRVAPRASAADLASQLSSLGLLFSQGGLGATLVQLDAWGSCGSEPPGLAVTLPGSAATWLPPSRHGAAVAGWGTLARNSAHAGRAQAVAGGLGGQIPWDVGLKHPKAASCPLRCWGCNCVENVPRGFGDAALCSGPVPGRSADPRPSFRQGRASLVLI